MEYQEATRRFFTVSKSAIEPASPSTWRIIVCVPFWSRMLHSGAESTDRIASIMEGLVSMLGTTPSRASRDLVTAGRAPKTMVDGLTKQSTIPVLVIG